MQQITGKNVKNFKWYLYIRKTYGLTRMLFSEIIKDLEPNLATAVQVSSMLIRKLPKSDKDCIVEFIKLSLAATIYEDLRQKDKVNFAKLTLIVRENTAPQGVEIDFDLDEYVTPERQALIASLGDDPEFN